MNSNLILFLFSNAVFVPYIKGKHRLGRKGPHCAGLHFTAGKPQHILVLVLLMKFNKSLPHWNHTKLKGVLKEPASFWKSLESPLLHTCAYILLPLSISPASEPVSPSCQPLSCSLLTQLETTARALSICSHPRQCCKGQHSLRLLLYDTERRAQRTGLTMKAVFIQTFSLKAHGFFGAFRFAGIREMQQHVVD